MSTPFPSKRIVRQTTVFVLLLFSLCLPFRPKGTIVDFVGNGDGQADNSDLLFAAIKKAGPGGTVRLPKATNCFALNAAIPLGDSTVGVFLPANVTLQGDGTKFCTSNPTQDYLFGSYKGNFRIDGVIFEGSPALVVSGSRNPDRHLVSDITLTHDVFENITSMNPRGPAVLMTGQIRKLTWDSNLVQNIWQGGFDANSTNLGILFPNNGPGGSPCYNSQDGQLCDTGQGGVSITGGCSYCTFTHSVFRKIQNNALGINVRPEQLSTKFHVDAPGLVISDNEFDHIHRMNVEIGGFGNCIGECNFTVVPFIGPVIERNFVHYPQVPFWHSFGFSFVFNGSTDAVFRNNSVVNENEANCYGNAVGQAFEHAANSLTFVGNVISSVRNPCSKMHGWNGSIILGGINTQIRQGVASYQNNKICGPGAGAGGIGHETESVRMEMQYNYAAETCPEGQAIAKSKLAITFLNPPRPGSAAQRTLNIGVKSALSIAQVDFFLDNSATPFSTQQEVDVSPTFATDLLWRFHAQVETKKSGSGPHRVRVVARDVAGGTQEQTSNLP